MTATGAAVNNTNKKVIFKNCAPFTDCMIEINDTQKNDAQIVYIVMRMYNLIEYSDARRHQGVYGYIIEIKQLQTLITKLLISLLMKIIVRLSNLNNK